MFNKAISAPFIPKLKPTFWNKLYYFFYVAHFRSYSKAAILLRINQSTLSRAIKSLEQRLECVLLLRNQRGVVVLTPEGHRIMQPIAQFLIHLQGLEAVCFKCSVKENDLSVDTHNSEAATQSGREKT